MIAYILFLVFAALVFHGLTLLMKKCGRKWGSLPFLESRAGLIGVATPLAGLFYIVACILSPLYYEFPFWGNFKYRAYMLKISTSTDSVVEVRPVRLLGEWEPPFDGTWNRYILVKKEYPGVYLEKTFVIGESVKTGTLEVESGQSSEVRIALSGTSTTDFVTEVSRARGNKHPSACFCSIDGGEFETKYVMEQFAVILKASPISATELRSRAHEPLNQWLENQGIRSMKVHVLKPGQPFRVVTVK